MAHTGIFGPTRSGKTTLAKSLCGEFESRGIRCLVLDPYDAIWPSTWKTRDITAFIAKAKTSRRCALFVDEAGQLDLREPAHEWLLTGAAQWGHLTHIIGQSGVHLSPVGRAQITRLFLFRSTVETADYWRNVFVDDGIMAATTLERWQFLEAKMFGGVRVCTLKLS